ncbi:MAG: hypothetical protein ACTSVV_19485 [Promethearchaeota archaeon]
MSKESVFAAINNFLNEYEAQKYDFLNEEDARLRIFQKLMSISNLKIHGEINLERLLKLLQIKIYPDNINLKNRFDLILYDDKNLFLLEIKYGDILPNTESLALMIRDNISIAEIRQYNKEENVKEFIKFDDTLNSLATFYKNQDNETLESAMLIAQELEGEEKELFLKKKLDEALTRLKLYDGNIYFIYLVLYPKDDQGYCVIFKVNIQVDGWEEKHKVFATSELKDIINKTKKLIKKIEI